MSESPVSRGPAVRDGEVEEPLGVRAAGFLLQNFAPVLALTIAGGVVGGIAALALPQPYVDSAVIEVGARARNEPLENPIQAGWRVRGAMLDAARDLGVELDSTIIHRREEKTNELLRFMDVTVAAETASTARAILDRGIARLMADHQQAYAYEKTLLRDQSTQLETAVARLKTSIRETPPTYSIPEQESGARKELDELNARVFDLHRAIADLQLMLSDVHTPPTRVVARAAKVEQERSKAPIFVVAGTLFGLLLGLAFAGARSVMREQSDGDAPADPVMVNFLKITRQYRVMIASITLLAGIAGAVGGVLLPRTYQGVLVVAAARIEPYGPVVDFHTIDAQLETHVQRLVVAEQLSEHTVLKAYAVRDQPPTSKKLMMLALSASSRDAVSVRHALDRSLSHLRTLEGPLYGSEHQRLAESLSNLDAEVLRLAAGPITPKTQEALQRAIMERSEAKKRLSPLRTYPSKALAVMSVEQASRKPLVLALAMLALVAGAAVAYAIPFFLAARDRMRTRGPSRAA